MTTDISEKGLERLIVRHLTGLSDEAIQAAEGSALGDEPAGYAGAGYLLGSAQDYDREYALDVPHLLQFLRQTQPEVIDQLGLSNKGPSRLRFLARLRDEIGKRGIVDVLRNGVSSGPCHVALFYGTPTESNARARELWNANLFVITRQLRYSANAQGRALDLCLFINGLPIATFELKNRLTGQMAQDAAHQYRKDRDPRELLFQAGRCLVHFAVDDQEVMFCTALAGKQSWFLPFNKGYRDGAGNPPNPDGLVTDYLWRETLTREGLADIIENYGLVMGGGGKKAERKVIFPRYHQLDCVRRLLADARDRGAGRKYLVQHSAGSGKSNSIAWLAHQLVGLQAGGKQVFDTVVVVTDRRLLDQQISDTIKQFSQLSNIVGHAERAGHLRDLLVGGKRIIVTTVQKFPFILDDIGSQFQDRKFAIIIDEAHSSQGGKAMGGMHKALAGVEPSEEEDTEDKIVRLIAAKRMLTNASYFAFTATPKNKTLEMFGEMRLGPDGQPSPDAGFRPFHSYTMKQAIQEGFILDVLANYTPYSSYVELVKTVSDDPEFEIRRARKRLLRFVETHAEAIHRKAEIMVDHFDRCVVETGKVGGQARAMVVTGSIRQALEYYHAIRQCLLERKRPYKALVAFSGTVEFHGKEVTETGLNGFPDSETGSRLRTEPYRILVCADKFQTGYDEPLLHTMYVDKPLSGIMAVQTLSRLNRCHPQKHDTFILDFANDGQMIADAFQPFYRTTLLSRATDPDRLHDLLRQLADCRVYEKWQMETVVERFVANRPREEFESILDTCARVYLADLTEDQQVEFKGAARAFLRGYAFLSAILPYSNPIWEKQSIFLNLLVPKLPAPPDTDDTAAILRLVDMESYRVEVGETLAIKPDDEEGELDPTAEVAGGIPEPEKDLLSRIIKSFNEQFGGIPWDDHDRIERVVSVDLPTKVSEDPAYRNAILHSDRENVRLECARALEQAMMGLIMDHTELFKQWADNPAFKRGLTDMIFRETYNSAG